MTLIHQIDFNPANQSAFGTLETNELTPVFQDDFTAGLNTQKWNSSYTFTITAPAAHPTAGDIYTVNNQSFVVVSSAGTTLIAIGGGAPPASGNLTRVTGSGTTPIAFSAFTTQVGVQNGTGAAVDTNAGRLRLQCGTSSTGYAYIESRRILKYRAGQGTTGRFTPLFAAATADCLQLWGVGTLVANAPYDGYFLGRRASDGAFGIYHYIGGVAQPFIPQTSFNGDTLNGSGASGVNLDLTYGTPFQIKYPYLGYGVVNFWAQNPTTGGWILFHTIRYPNTTASLQLSNPNLRFIGFVQNSGNTSNKIMYCGSVGFFVSGTRSFVANNKQAIDNTKTGVTTETNIVTLRNANSYNGVSGRGLIRLQSIGVSVTTTTAANITIRLKIGAALGGSPSFTAINGTTTTGGIVLTSANSVASYDTAGTTITGGVYIWNLQLGDGNNGGANLAVDLTGYEIFIAPGETLTISGASTNSAAIGVSVNWTED